MWDGDTPKIGSSISFTIGAGTPAERLSEEAAGLRLQAKEERGQATRHRNNADYAEQMAISLDETAGQFEAAAKLVAGG